MKTIIYAGIGLFSVASVYGITDYYTSQKNSSLENLYKEEEVAEESIMKKNIVTEHQQENIAVVNLSTSVKKEAKKEVAKSKKNKKSDVKKPRKIDLDDYSRGRILPEEEIIVAEEKEPIQSEEAKPAIDKAEIISILSERKINMNMFSRAPLKKINPVKKVETSVVIKE